MLCTCGTQMKCIDTRDAANLDCLHYAPRRRRHECPDCLNRITTYEIEATDLDELKSPSLNAHKKRILAAVVDAIENTK